MSINDMEHFKAKGILPGLDLLNPALQIAAVVPSIDDPIVLRRVLTALDGATVWDEAADALGFYPEGGTSLIPVRWVRR